MKSNPEIDELLNSFIDGEATVREQTEVHRMISHDKQIAHRLAELRKCKTLVSSLPAAEVPSDVAIQIKAAIDRTPETTPFARKLVSAGQAQGARYLLARKLLAAAAMIGLVAVLAMVVYTIIAPEGPSAGPIVVRDWQNYQPPPEVALPAVEKSVAAAKPVGDGFTGRLEFKTATFTAADAFISRSIEQNSYCVCYKTNRGNGVGEYNLNCSREGLNLLLADLENIWTRFDSATLFVETGTTAEPVEVAAISPEQAGQIANQQSGQKRLEVARNFAALNNMANSLPGREIFAAIDNTTEHLITIPEPVLTSSEKKTKKTTDHQLMGEENVNLTIVVISNE